jgi:CelD/BcsL family acetyltransferase involved in cellulose biosynthesis
MAIAKECSDFVPPMGRFAEAAGKDRAFATVEVYRDPAAVLRAWEEIEAVAPISAYQTRAFLIPWLETLGASLKIAPLFIAAKDRHGRTLALLCLGVEKRGPFRVACFLGARAANFNLALYRPDVALTAKDVEVLLRSAASALGPAAPDAFVLLDQPFEWLGTKNPFAQLPHQLSPNVVLATVLDPDSKKFLASKLSGNARRQLRVKEERLAELLGPVAFISNDTPARADAILDAFFAQRIARFRAQGIDADFSNPAMQAFWRILGRPSATRAAYVEFYALTAGGRIVATIAGATHRGCFSFSVNSIDTDPEVARTSPGVLIIAKLIALQCEKKVKHFDCGPGEARYKEQFCDRTIPLFDLFIPVRLRGHVFAVESSWLRLKRAIKRSPRLYDFLRQLKRMAHARKSA